MTSAPERPAPATDLHAEAEIRQAARALMRVPMIFDGGPHEDALRLVRRHRVELTRLFADGLGYRLVVEPGVVRLFKPGLGRDSSRGLLRRNGTAFTPRRYALLVLVLAALTRSRAQLMIDELVAEVRASAAEARIDVDLDAMADRRALHSAVVALCDLGVITERDGDLEHWVERRSESLLDIHRERLGVLLAAPLSGCRNAGDLLAVASVPSAAGGARVACRRILTERPVLSAEELTDEQREWWGKNRNREREWFRRALGLDLELRAEGAVAIDAEGDLTDREFPGAGSARHYALLLLEALVGEARAIHGSTLAGTTWVRLAQSTVRRHGDEVFRTWREGFRKAFREDPDALHTAALELLAGAGLLRAEDGNVLIHAASARYAARPLLLETATTGERSLFDEEDS